MIPSWSIGLCKLFCCCNVFLGVLLAALGAAPGDIIAQFFFAIIMAAWVWFAEWHNERAAKVLKPRRKKDEGEDKE